MKFTPNKKYTSLALYVFFTFAACTVFYLVASQIGSVSRYFSTIWALLLPFIIGFVIAYLLNPILVFSENKVFAPLLGRDEKPRKGLVRGLSLLVTYLAALLFVLIFLKIVVPQLIDSVTGLAFKGSDMVNSAASWIRESLSKLENETLPKDQVDFIVSKFNEALKALSQLLNESIPYVIGVTKSITIGVKNIILGVIISVYILMSKEKFFAQLRKICYAFLSKGRVESAQELANSCHRIFSGFITGKILDSLIIGIICFFGMTIFHMPYAMLVSVIVGVTNVIPYFGPFIGAIPSAIIILLVDPMACLGFLVFILVLQQFDGNILGPKILGDTTGLSAFWVIFAILVGGGLFGFIGMFIGVPAFSVLYMLISQALNRRLKARGYPCDTESYALQNNMTQLSHTPQDLPKDETPSDNEEQQ